MIVAEGVEQRKAATTEAGTLTSEQKAVCAMLRMDEATFLKSQKEFAH